MRIMTWNINSVRLRIDMLMQVLEKVNPDVFCLQETKTPDKFFPVDPIVAKGYPHYHFAGMKGYNGVCIFSKHPLDNIGTHKRCGKDDMRHISARVNAKKGMFDVHNVYVPAGGYEPDLNAEKFKHKLDFVDDLSKWFLKNRSAKDPMIVLGDLNIAPLENDVWDHKKLIKVVSHTPIEIEKFANLAKSMDWVDAIRHFVPEDEKLYSWWSYRSPNWDAADKGRRLDHIWVTQKLVKGLQKQQILRDVRGWERPSDHAPVVLDFKLSG